MLRSSPGRSVQRFDQRQGFLVSAIIHLTLLMLLSVVPNSPRSPNEIDVNSLERKDLVFLPPAAVLRQLAPALPQPVPAPTPSPAKPPLEPKEPPSPPPQTAQQAPPKKDRISVGPPSDVRLKGPMILHRDDDLTKVAKGSTSLPTPPPPAPTSRAPERPGTPRPEPAEGQQGLQARAGQPGLRLPPGLFGERPAGTGAQAGRTGRQAENQPSGTSGDQLAGTSIDRSAQQAVDRLSQRIDQNARLGLPTGTGKSIGGLYFDPQGADFTLWVQRFKDEVYRNWIVPTAAEFGFRGHVDFVFVVERNGSISDLRMEKSSGTPAFDKAAQFALTSSKWDSLPDDYGPPRITMRVTFFYNEGPQGS
jgi:TonB family protein